MLPLSFVVSLSDFAFLDAPGAQFRELLLHASNLERVKLDVLEEPRAIIPAPIEYVHAQEFVISKGGS